MTIDGIFLTGGCCCSMLLTLLIPLSIAFCFMQEKTKSQTWSFVCGAGIGIYKTFFLPIDFLLGFIIVSVLFWLMFAGYSVLRSEDYYYDDIYYERWVICLVLALLVFVVGCVIQLVGVVCLRRLVGDRIKRDDVEHLDKRKNSKKSVREQQLSNVVSSNTLGNGSSNYI